jgi:hypothetical protein
MENKNNHHASEQSQQQTCEPTQLDQINNWAKERGLLDIDWDKSAHASFIAEELSEFLRAKTDNEEIDALCDMVVFAVNAMRIKGYDPNVAMAETIKEISSRTGAFNPQTGKWEKFKTEEAKALWYAANYDEAKCKK